MLVIRFLLSITLAAIIMTAIATAAQPVLVVKFDCQAPLRYLTDPLADSLVANLRTLQIPVVSRSTWETTLEKNGYRENDLNYNPPVLARMIGRVNACGAIYGQVYVKNGLTIMDAFYLESGSMQPIDIDPMIGYSGEDMLEMTWNLAVIISQPDKQKPQVIKVEPSDSAVVTDDYVEMKLYFNEPMNPDSYGLTGEPEGMFSTYGDVEYIPDDFCFKFNVHLYAGQDYKFWVNGSGVQPFMDSAGNVARSYRWHITTK
jgi:hypothetical protein